MKTANLTYYACARNARGKIEQLLVTRVMKADETGAVIPGACVSKAQTWTGVVYKTEADAAKDLAQLNRRTR